MTDQAALLAAIIAEPADDTRRLAYADFLDEHAEEVECKRCGGTGNTHNSDNVSDPAAFPCQLCSGTGRVSNGFAERAEFVRVQIELARGCSICEYGDYLSKRVKQGRCPWCATAIRRINELLAAHQREWFHIDGLSGVGFGENEPLCWWPAGDSRGEPKPRIEGTPTRGFVSALTCSWSDWVRHHDAIRKAQPIERVRLTDRPEMPVYSDNVFRILAHRWPGIEFELPAEEPTAHLEPGETDDPDRWPTAQEIADYRREWLRPRGGTT